MMLNKSILVGFLVGLSLATNGCKGSKGSQSDSGDEQPEEVQPKSDEGGVVVAGIVTDKTQLLRASASGGLAGTEVVFPAGALAIATDVTLAEGAALDLAASKAELGIDETVEVTAASSTILITVADAQDLQKPVTITTTLAEGAGLVPVGKRYALLSHVTKSGVTTVMVNSNLDFRTDGNKISFPISFFGAHGVILVPEDFGETKEAPTARPLPDQKGGQNPDPDPDPTPTALTVVSMSPAAGAKIALPASIELTFSESIDGATSSAGISVTRGGSVVSGSVSVNGAKAVFFPTQSFIVGQAYTISVAKTLKSVGGTGLAEAYSASFTVNDGGWSTTTAAVGSETSGSYTVLVSLGAGKYGIARTQPSTSIDTYLYSGSAWGPKASFSDASVGEFQTVLGSGGVDGRFYVLGDHSSKAHVMRYNPALAAPKLLAEGLNPAPTSMSNIRVVALGQGEALYFYQASMNSHARSLKGDTLGVQENVGTIGTYPYPVVAGSVSGVAAVAGVAQINAKNALKVFRRAAGGAWSDLTPNGNELTDDLQSNPFRLLVTDAGNPVVFWCINELTEANVCYLTAHNGTSWSAVKSFTSVSTVNSPEFSCDEMASTCSAIWTESIAEMMNIHGAIFKKDTWSATSVISTTTSGYPKAQMDRAGRIMVAWTNDDYSLKYIRYDGKAWGAVVNIVASDVMQLYSLAVDQSGGVMALIGKQNEQQATMLHTVQFK